MTRSSLFPKPTKTTRSLPKGRIRASDRFFHRFLSAPVRKLEQVVGILLYILYYGVVYSVVYSII